MDDEELARAMRAGLQRRAEDVDTRVPVVAAHGRPPTDAGGSPSAPRARCRDRGAGRRVTGTGGDDESVVGGSDGSHAASELPGDWRTEQWHGVQVQVPSDWGWGPPRSGWVARPSCAGAPARC